MNQFVRFYSLNNQYVDFFNVDFNNENKFLSLAYGCRNDVAVFNKFDANAVSILIFRKHAYAHFNVSL